jgi:hypothetical protein
MLGVQDTSSLLSSAAVDETESCRSQPGCFRFSFQCNTTAQQAAAKPAPQPQHSRQALLMAGFFLDFWMVLLLQLFEYM